MRSAAAPPSPPSSSSSSTPSSGWSSSGDVGRCGEERFDGGDLDAGRAGVSMLARWKMSSRSVRPKGRA
eukprot:scaffold97711_cov60-Phaeocystis_antarctica.AAC.1